jgi:hypothetical protein
MTAYYVRRPDGRLGLGCTSRKYALARACQCGGAVEQLVTQAAEPHECPDCLGTGVEGGHDDGDTCGACDGSGRLSHAAAATVWREKARAYRAEIAADGRELADLRARIETIKGRCESAKQALLHGCAGVDRITFAVESLDAAMRW